MSENKNVVKQSHNNKKASLGRGLGSLLGGGDDGAFSKTADKSSTAQIIGKTLPSQNIPAIKEGFQEPVKAQTPPELRIWKIGIEKLKPNPKQPRQVFDKEPLDELAASIRQKGILQPLLAKRINEHSFEIIAGERRWRAAQLADLKEVPVILKEISDKEALELALIENIQRQELNPIEEAEAYDHLMTEYKLTQQDLADRVGKERVTVANMLRLLKLCPEVRLMVSIGEVGHGHAKVLLAVPDKETQIKLADKVKQENLTVRALEKLIAKMQSKDEVTPVENEDVHIRSLREELQKGFGTKVGIDYNAGKGKLILHFHSDDEFNGLVERMRKTWRS
jgi:ParB family transcriptional regulator, chromosome partitioning protein